MPLNSEMPLLRSYPQVGSLLWYMQRCTNIYAKMHKQSCVYAKMHKQSCDSNQVVIYNRTYKQLEVPIIDVFKLKYRFLYNKILCSQEKKRCWKYLTLENVQNTMQNF